MAVKKFAEAEQKIISVNYKKGIADHLGIILHIMDGTLSGTDAWFHNPHAQASSHFGVGRGGKVIQWVDEMDTAWTEASGNPFYLSIECEGKGGDSLSPAQLNAIARIYEYEEDRFQFGFKSISKPGQKGLGHHSMGGKSWGGHLSCPGDKIIAQKPKILELALAIRATKGKK